MEKKTNLMHLMLTLDIGGLEVLVVNLLEEIDTSRYNRMICCLDRTGDLSADSGIPVYPLGRKAGFDTGLIFRLAALFKKNRVDIVHSHNWGAHVYGSIAARLAGVPVVVHTQHSKLVPFSRKKYLAGKVTGRLTNRFIAVSRDVADFMRNSGWADDAGVILNGVNTARFSYDISKREAVRKEFGIPRGAAVITNIARLSMVKDHATLIKAFWMMRKKDTFLLIAGDGPMMGGIRQLVNDCGLDGSVILPGMRNDIPALLAASDMFVLSSKSEGIPVALLEAMSAGLPCIATGVGGNVEIIRDNINGMLVGAEDPERLAGAMGALLGNPALALALGREGRQTVIQRFSIKNMVAQYTNIYEMLKNEKNSRDNQPVSK